MAPTQPASISATHKPVAILWAYQLQREHSLLTTRFDALERTNSELMDWNRSLKMSVQTLTSKVAKLEKSLNDVKAAALELVEKAQTAEVEKNRMEKELIELRKERDEDSEIVGVVDRDLGKLEEENGEREGALEKLMGVLNMRLREADDLKAVVAKNEDLSRRVALLEHRRAPDPVQESVEEMLETQRSGTTLRQSEISTRGSTPFPQIRTAPSCPEQPGPSFFPENQASTYNDQASLFRPEPPVTDQDVLNVIQQGSLGFDSYAEETGTKLPRFGRPVETTIVQAFVNGLGDADDRALIENILNPNGWTWEVDMKVSELEKKRTEDKKNELERQREQNMAHVQKQKEPRREFSMRKLRSGKAFGRATYRFDEVQATREERRKTLEGDELTQGQHGKSVEAKAGTKRKPDILGRDVTKERPPEPRKRPKRVGGHWLKMKTPVNKEVVDAGKRDEPE